MKDFVFRMPTRVRFGIGITKTLGKILKEELRYSNIFIASDPGIVQAGLIDRIEEALKAEGIRFCLYDQLVPDPTIEVVDEAADVLRKSGAEAVLAVGGGSVIDTAKAMCMLQTHEGSIRDYLFGGSKSVSHAIMPLICIPTTAGTGSEMTAASVITDQQTKTKVSVTHENLIPRLAVIDPQLQAGMPPLITATTGMDALTHAIESYVSLNAGPISDAMGLAAVKQISQNLRTAAADGSNLQARANMAVASTMAGAAFMNGGLGVVHGIAQAIGAAAHVPHGTANALLLPYCMRRNVVGTLKKFKDIADAMGENTEGLTVRAAADRAVSAVFQLDQDLKVPMHLKQVGVTHEMFPKIIKATMEYRMLTTNPCQLSSDDVLSILQSAY